MITSCEYNEPAALELTAQHARITIAAAGIDSLDHVQINGLALNNYAEGKVRVRIVTPPGTPRSVYQLKAEFREPLFYSLGECAARHEWEAKLKEHLGTLTVPAGTPPFGFTWPKPTPPEIVSPTLAGALYTSFTLGAGSALDIIVSAPTEQPALARLYDLDGVLLAESAPADVPEASAIGSWFGLVPSARIVTQGLSPQQPLVLQIVPAAVGGTLGTAGLSSRSW
jgi:hypothetical protein